MTPSHPGCKAKNPKNWQMVISHKAWVPIKTWLVLLIAASVCDLLGMCAGTWMLAFRLQGVQAAAIDCVLLRGGDKVSVGHTSDVVDEATTHYGEPSGGRVASWKCLVVGFQAQHVLGVIIGCDWCFALGTHSRLRRTRLSVSSPNSPLCVAASACRETREASDVVGFDVLCFSLSGDPVRRCVRATYFVRSGVTFLPAAGDCDR